MLIFIANFQMPFILDYLVQLDIPYLQIWTAQFMPSWIPSPFFAEHAWICHGRSRMAFRLSPSAIYDLKIDELIHYLTEQSTNNRLRTSSPGRAVTRSCLLANTNTGTFLSLDSCSNSLNYWPLI